MEKERREKRLVTLGSVVATIFLIGLKLGVGLWTGSLGILAEAADSGLDLIATLITFFAVRLSDKPADAHHTYGHGKVENLSALAETFILLLTCLWIISEAINRLFFEKVVVEANFWAFAVICVSIAVNFFRSRFLRRAALKYKSQALEADALNFSTDILSSLVVIFGLILVRVGDSYGWSALGKADAVAALGVAMIVIYVSLQLGRRAVSVLLDAAPEGIVQQIKEQVRRVPGVCSLKQVRVRRAGAYSFADMTISVERSASFEQAHAVAAEVEAAVSKLLPRADVVVHIDPVAREDESVADSVRLIASRYGLLVHDLHIYDVRGRFHLELHVEVDESLSLGEAHRLVSQFEKEVMSNLKNIAQVNSHIEPISKEGHRQPAIGLDEREIRQEVERISRQLCAEGHQVDIRVVDGELEISLHCVVEPDMPLKEAHELTRHLEDRLRECFPDLRRALIHVEPREN
ncbi:MAG: cation-efflux pump [Anaerolineae bacterium]